MLYLTRFTRIHHYHPRSSACLIIFIPHPPTHHAAHAQCCVCQICSKIRAATLLHTTSFLAFFFFFLIAALCVGTYSLSQHVIFTPFRALLVPATCSRFRGKVVFEQLHIQQYIFMNVFIGSLEKYVIVYTVHN